MAVNKLEILIEAIDKASRPIKQLARTVEDSMKGVEKSVKKATSSFSSMIEKHKEGFDNLGKM